MHSDGRHTRRWLEDMRHHIELAQTFIAGSSFDAFKDDDMRLLACIRCLEVISEASRRLPDDLKERYPSIKWKEMAAAGNFYRHEYEDVGANRVWHTLTHDLPILQKVVVFEIEQLEKSK